MRSSEVWLGSVGGLSQLPVLHYLYHWLRTASPAITASPFDWGSDDTDSVHKKSMWLWVLFIVSCAVHIIVRVVRYDVDNEPDTLLVHELYFKINECNVSLCLQCYMLQRHGTCTMLNYSSNSASTVSAVSQMARVTGRHPRAECPIQLVGRLLHQLFSATPTSCLATPICDKFWRFSALKWLNWPQAMS